MVYCCVPLCKSSGRTAKGITFHEFPVTELRTQWLKRISRQAEGPGKALWTPSDRSKVCSLHFKEGDFREGLKIRKLKPDAVPSVFPQYPTYLQQWAKKERRLLKRKPAKPASPTGRDAKAARLDANMTDGSVAEISVTMAEVPAPSVIPTATTTMVQAADSHELEVIPQGLSLDALVASTKGTSLESVQQSSPDVSPEPTFSTKVTTMVHGVQTRLTFPRMNKLLKQVNTLKRKCRRLIKKRDELQAEISVLRQQTKRTETAMKKSNFTILQEKVQEDDAKALFLQEQLSFLSNPKGRWREETIRNCVVWHAKSPSAYNLLRETGVLSLPSRSTLKRHIGACTGEVVSSLIKQRLHMEAKLHSEQARLGSLVMDEMSLKQTTSYQKQSDVVHGFVDLGGAEVDFGLHDQLATHLLCFVFVGLSTHYRLPVGYYFTKALSGEQLQLLALKVMQCVEESGFKVVRLVGDNHKSNTKFFSNLSGGPIQPVVEHPLDSDRELFLSFDYCHIIKNIRSQFLEVKRLLRRNGKFILPDFLKLLYEIQEKQGAFKLVRCLTKKHLWPTNFEKMNVNRAVQVFSPQVTTVLRFLQQHGQSLGAPGFEDCLPTVEFMEFVHKWFVLHNIKSTTLHWTSRDALRMPFYSAEDERLSWLENDFLKYFMEWKEGISYKMEFLSDETYEALRVTSMSTVLCTRFLLKSGFHFVLTAKFSSDDVESLFSTIRQLNGCNDQTDAYAALSSLQKILVTGIIHTSSSANAGSVVGSLGKSSKLFPIPVKATSDSAVKKLLLPHLGALERYPSAPQRSLRASTLAMIAGFLVRAVQDCIACEGCLINLRAPASQSTTTAIIAGMDRGGLSYPTLAFVGFVSRLEGAASSVAPVLVRGPRPLKKFADLVLPSLAKNTLFVCSKDTTGPHRMALLKLIVHKFMRPFLSNFASDLTEVHAKRKLISAKPKSRKVLKV
ncbi:uncharacterized protein LOC144094136 [Amblyomma americanum]